MSAFGWNDLRFFVELVRSKSFMAAGRRLKADHTTVRRRIAALETALDAKLLNSGDQLFDLTSAGEALLHYAEEIESLAMRASEKVMDADVQISGTVRIGAPDGFGAWFLTPRLKKLIDVHPDLHLEVAAIPRTFNLSKREVDIAIALSPPSQNRQIVRKLTATRLSLYASADYLKTRPLTSLAGLIDHVLITYISDLLYAPELDYPSFLGVTAGATFETSSLLGQMRAAVAGIGIAILPHYLAADEPSLRQLLPDEFSLEREFWLVVHPDLIKLARIRTVIDFIVSEVQANRSLFLGPVD